MTAGEACDPPNAGICSSSCEADPDVVPVDWTSPTGGAAGAVAATLESISTPQLSSADLSGASFAALPASANAETVDYGSSSDWRFGVSQSVDAILVYAVSWRGAGGGVDPVTYDFDSPFAIFSGFEGASVENAGTRLVLPADGLHSGVLHFAGPIEGLELDVSATTGAFQAMTFSRVPEPSNTISVVLGTLLTLWFGARRDFSVERPPVAEHPPLPKERRDLIGHHQRAAPPIPERIHDA